MTSMQSAPLEMPPATPPPMVSDRLRIREKLVRHGGYLVLLLLVLVFAVVKPGVFLSASNVRSILELGAVPAILAMAVTPVLLAGEFDLAFTSIAGLSAAVMAVLMAHLGWPAVPAVAVALLVGAAGGAASSIVVVHERVQSFIGTLAIGSVAAGIEIAVGNNTEIYSGISKSFLSFVNDKPLLGLTTPVWVTAGLALALIVLVRWSTIGHQLGAIGGNKDAAAFAGVRIHRRLSMVFVLSGLVAGLAGAILVGQADAYAPNAAGGFLLSSYTAVFVGLAFNGRSRFSIGGTLLGVLLIVILENGLNITNQPVWAESVINGLVLIAAVRITLGKRRA